MTRAKTDSSLKKNLSKLTTIKTKSTPTRKTRSDKKPVFTKVKSDAKWELGNGNGNIGNTMPWYLHPVKKDAFNRSWLSTYDRACEHIQKLKLRPEEYTLWQLTKRKS
tara:strand:+ start:795 stop:1118 length:324 start_codon:yes stop_codon:yes gene_type:complete